MATISKAAVVFLVNSTELDLCLPLKVRTNEQTINKETQPQTVLISPTPATLTDNSLINRLSRFQNNKTTTAPTEFLIIAAKSAVQIDKKLLELYEYEPFLKSNQIAIVDKIKEEEPEGSYILINNTARKIGIRNKVKDNSEIIIPAFGSRRIDESVLNQHDYEPWKDLNLIQVNKDEQLLEQLQKEKWMAFIVWVAYGWFFILILKWIGLGKYFGDPSSTFSFSIWIIWPAIAVLIAVVYLLREFKKGLNKGISIFASYLFKFINLLGFYVWPLLLPIVVVLFFGGVLNVFLEIINGGTEPIMNSSYFSAGFLLRLMQLVFIVILSSIPGMLYFQYERRQIGTLRAQFIRNIMFLNPLIHTTDDAEIEYGKLVDEVTISSGANTRQFSILRSGRPIIISTMLITLCWIFTLWPVGEVPDVNSNEVINLLSPRLSLISFAFLGAYFFALNLLFKRYSRGDLSPKAYNHISIRIISAIILVWVLGVVISDSAREITKASFLVMAFGIGLIPETGLTLLKQLMESKKMGKIFPSFKAKHPITELEGISLYDQARLTEEGVENVETLAHHNMIELMLRSGIPVARLVDLLDQAILYLHTTGIVQEPGPDEKNNSAKRGIDVLRNEGIRTATDLLSVEKAILDQANDTDNEKSKRRNPDTFYTLLDPEGKPSFRLQRVLDALKDDEWLVYIQNWRNIGLCLDTVVTDPNEIMKEERKRVVQSGGSVSSLPEPSNKTT
jgi:hypothetical protein